jgi:hypothetical protein
LDKKAKEAEKIEGKESIKSCLIETNKEVAKETKIDKERNAFIDH